MKNRNYTTMNFRVNDKKKFYALWAFAILLFITLLRSQVLYPNLALKNNPSPTTRGTDVLISSFFTDTPWSVGRRLPPPGGRPNDDQTVSSPSPCLLSQAADKGTNDWLDELIEKIWFVEASYRLNPPDGDDGAAVGPLQIHQSALDDVNRRFGTDFEQADIRNIETAKLIAKLYMSMWLEIHKEEIAARIFNGGPRGWQKKSTDSYWQDIQAVK